MELLFLGTGAAIYQSASDAADNYNSNMILEHQGKRLLIDCGIDIKYSLQAANLSFTDIDAVYISHLHFDHAGGLEWLALSTMFHSDKNKPTLHIHESLVTTLWENSLRAGLSTLDDSKAELSSFFTVAAVDEPNNFTWQGISFQLIKTIHIYNDQQLVPSYGLLFTVANELVFITTDTRFTPDIFMPFYEQATLIFHDCDVSEQPSSVHASYQELTSLPEATKAKMWLYHYSTSTLPDAQHDGFRGFVTKGQRFELNNT